MMYEASALNDVWKGDSAWQYGLVMNCASGTAARTAHQSLTTLPLLVPPEKEKPFTARTLKLTSTPLNTRVSSPTSFVDLTRRFGMRRAASGVLLQSGPMTLPPP